MRVEIENFAKLNKAVLEVNGITVIAGENNTGKSTIGKILFAFFNAASGIDRQIKNFRVHSIEAKLLYFFYRNRIRTLGDDYSSFVDKASYCLLDNYNDNNSIDKDSILDIIKNNINVNFENYSEDEFYSLASDIKILLSWADEKIASEIFTDFFNKIFNSQINSLLKQGSDAFVRIKIKDDENELCFSENTCRKADLRTNISNNCIYIDDPLILDECGSNFLARSYFSDYKKQKTIAFLDKYFHVDNSPENMLDVSMIKEKMKDIFAQLNSMVEGNVIANNRTNYFKQNKYKEDLNLNNLSTGLKSVVILKMLVEKLLLKDRDLFILDEPEIHLHPKWQIIYAEIIVLLQKALNLHVVITTHSPYFLDAIELYSKKHGGYSKFKCYVSDLDESSQVSFIDITDNLEIAYEKLAYPIAELNTLRYELSNE